MCEGGNPGAAMKTPRPRNEAPGHRDDGRVRLQMLLNNLSSVGTEALARLGLEFKRLSSDVAIVAA